MMQATDAMPFLSTLSLRRATAAEHRLLALNSISIHALLAESDKPDKKAGSQEKDFYPRSPCGERHGETMPSIGHISYFYPRSPCGERLDVNNPVAALTSISIHALLAESDCYSLRHSAQGRYFYPRSPCGERHQPVTMHTWRKVFLSTLSLRRATAI